MSNSEETRSRPEKWRGYIEIEFGERGFEIKANVRKGKGTENKRAAGFAITESVKDAGDVAAIMATRTVAILKQSVDGDGRGSRGR